MCVDLPTWLNYLETNYPVIVENGTLDRNFLNVSHPILDESITFDELSASLARCKNGKAPGVGGIGNAFYKNRPQNWLLYMLHLFNNILSTESVPEDWGRLVTFMLYKRKGSIDDPHSYRPISLVNNVASIFTQILCSRLVAWASELNLIPESQSGFRKG